MKRHQDCGGILSNSWCEMHEIRIWIWLVSTYVVCERLSMMHKQVSGWTVNFCPNSPESPFLEFQTRKPPPQWKTSDLRWPKFTPKYPPPKWKTSDLRWPKFTLKYPPTNEKLQIWDDQSLLQNTPPKMKTSDLRWPKFTPKYPPNEKLQIWDDQSLLWKPRPNDKLQIWDD